MPPRAAEASVRQPSRVAAVQLRSSADRAQNLLVAAGLVAQAADGGAQLALLPENFSGVPARESDRQSHCEQDGSGMAQDFLSEQAARHGLWLIGGSVWLRDPESGLSHNSCLVYAPDGARAARYDKMHLFDVQVETDGKVSEHRESSFFAAGKEVRTASADGLCVGMSVCYDLRFPELYRQLQAMGAELMIVPSAFTAATGKLHWEVLLRARAVENQCYLLAANQCGRHEDGKESWGHSMIVDPWGAVAACVQDGNGVAIHECDWGRMRRYRDSFPALRHTRLHPGQAPQAPQAPGQQRGDD